jgi:radical SAM superfamily enzyme YgiQ (UPF0313 family)
MKVLLSHGYFIEEDLREKTVMKPYPPLGILYISAYIERLGIEHEVFDTTFFNRVAFDIKLEQYKPSVLALYCNLVTKVNIVQIMRDVKARYPKMTIVVGGPDVRFNKDAYLHCGADIAVIGEGEESFAEVLRSIGQENASFGRIKGIAFKKEGQVVTTEERALLKDINELPSPAYHKIEVSDYLHAWKSRHGQSMLSISSQRGCPYTCKWCSTAVYGQSYRRRSAQKVVEEMMLLKQTYQIDALWFVDDVFTVSHKWLKEFRHALHKNDVKLPFECITRADRLNEESIQLLKGCGCFRVWIGAESGSQRILDAMDRRVSVEQVRKTIRMARDAGIETGTFIMLGYPGETEEDIDETIEHLVEADPNHFTITLAYPIKGTDLYKQVESLQTKDIDWTTTSDRQRDFKRTYRRKYYDFAIRKVVNEVHYQKGKKHGSSLYSNSKFYIKSRIATLAMGLFK